MRIVRIDGHAFHVAVSGDPAGRPLVFLNSLGTDLRVWDAVLAHLPPGLRVIRHDKRGHGLSDTPARPWRIEDFADDLVGLSVGGLIAQALAARRPDLVQMLILSGTAPRIGTPELWNDRIRRVETEGIAAIADGILERWFSAGYRTTDPAFALWRNMLTRSPADGYTATCAAIRDADLTESTRRLRLPTLAMVGDADGSTPPEIVRATAALIPGARFEVIEGAGHLPGVERPELVARLIADFLAETGYL
jgi:3-oxoadipate enol-lactonase